jgi:thiosulfate/3-mercaptopyruvate sulfurtransferase
VDAGLEPDDEIVTYCTGGIRSAFMQLMMEMEGYQKVKNYEGSYYNWAAVNEVE